MGSLASLGVGLGLWERHQGWAKGISTVIFLKDLRLRELLPCLFLPTALRVRFINTTYAKDPREANAPVSSLWI